MLESTLAGLAAGLVAQGLVTPDDSLTQRPRLDIVVRDEVVDLALIDAVVCHDVSIASRAIWDMTKITAIII